MIRSMQSQHSVELYLFFAPFLIEMIEIPRSIYRRGV